MAIFTTNAATKALKSTQAGLTLLELMIALALSSFLLLGVFQIFKANITSSHLQTGYSRVQENGRMGIELISRDIRMADSRGCVTATTIENQLNPADPDYDPALIPKGKEDAVTGEDNVTGTAIGGINVVDNTDTLTLKGSVMVPKFRIVAPFMATTTADIYVSIGTDIALGETLILTSCKGSDIFSNTTADTKTSGIITHSKGAAAPTKNDIIDNLFDSLAYTYDHTAQLAAPFTKTYFVGENSVNGSSLYVRNGNINSELVRGITDLQFIYGVGTSGDNKAVDTLGKASEVNMPNVLSIRITLEAQSNDNIAGGAPLTRNYTATANIRNRTL